MGISSFLYHEAPTQRDQDIYQLFILAPFSFKRAKMYISSHIHSLMSFLMPHGSCFNWYFPDDDDEEEGSHGSGLQSQRAALSTPELSINRNGGQDCTTDSAQYPHLWLSPAELTVWILFLPLCVRNTLHPYWDADKRSTDLWPFALTPDPPLSQTLETTDKKKKRRYLQSLFWTGNVQLSTGLLFLDSCMVLYVYTRNWPLHKLHLSKCFLTQIAYRLHLNRSRWGQEDFLRFITEPRNGERTLNVAGCWCQMGCSEYFRNCWSTGMFTSNSL